MPHKHRFLIRPLFLQVRDDLAMRITAGEWKAGTTLPNEQALSLQMGVSQGTVRKALDLLETEQIVDRRQGRGTFVVDHDTEEMAVRFSSIYNHLEQKISGHVVHSEAEFGLPSIDEQKILRIDAQERTLRAKRTRAYHDHPFMVEESVLVVRYFPGITIEAIKNARISSIAQKYGVQLSHATEIVSPIMCLPNIAEKLGLTELIPILKLDRVVRRNDGLPVEMRIAWCHLRDKHYMSVLS